MLPDSGDGAVQLGKDPAEAIYRLYAAQAQSHLLDPASGLGGKLLYAGDLAAHNSALLFAANIAGSASIAASADLAVQRQAIRDGAVDFLVTSLEEALRILKNEVRKRQTVSVGVSVDPRRLTQSMLERGVLPDLLAPSQWPASDSGLEPAQRATFLAQGACELAPDSIPSGDFITWTLQSAQPREFAVWLPRLDLCAQRSIPADDLVRQRWLRLVPRYLGRLAQRSRGIVLNDAEAASFRSCARELQIQFQAAVATEASFLITTSESPGQAYSA
jgi:hypothetical protein